LVKLPVGWMHALSLALYASPLFFIQKSPCLFALDKIDGTRFCHGSSTCLFSQCSCPFLHRTTIHCTLPPSRSISPLLISARSIYPALLPYLPQPTTPSLIAML
jgi:hypothetical protein